MSWWTDALDNVASEVTFKDILNHLAEAADNFAEQAEVDGYTKYSKEYKKEASLIRTCAKKLK